MNSTELHRHIEPRTPELLQLVRKLLTFRKEGRLLIQAGDTGFASAPSNIALLKYWGKKDQSLQIPVSSSISRNLDAFRSRTQVRAITRFFPVQEDRFVAHRLSLNNQVVGPLPEKMRRFVDLFLQDWAPEIAVEITSFNNFPTGCGVASSASGYAALAGALTHMAGLDLLFDKAELELWLTSWARLGSGSATRSAMLTSQSSAFVAWKLLDERVGLSEQMPITDTFEIAAHSELYKLRHYLFVVSDKEKQISSSAGHQAAEQSVFQKLRVAGMPQRFRVMKAALESGDFETIRILAEEDALSMHAVMATSAIPVQYITDATAQVIAHFLASRERRGWNALWTLDAGPNVHFLVESRDAAELVQCLATLAQDMKLDASAKVISADWASRQMGQEACATGPQSLALGDGLTGLKLG